MSLKIDVTYHQRSRKQMTKQIQTFSLALEALRNFFKERQVVEVLTPPAVQNPGVEPHLHPFQLKSAQTKQDLPLYLHTSPEFWMKWILAHADELPAIYTLSYCFRDEPKSEWHRPQFLMLEWYRKNADLGEIIQDCQGLLSCMLNTLNISESYQHQVISVKELFQQVLKVDLDDLLEVEPLRNYINKFHSDLAGASELELWEDLFFLLFLNKIEPELQKFSSVFLTHFPKQLAALSNLDPDDTRYCLRFEWYIKGVEIANCFNELKDLKEQKKRAKSDLNKKEQLYQIKINEPEILYEALEKGLPDCSGVALGFERLLKVIKKDYNFLYL